MKIKGSDDAMSLVKTNISCEVLDPKETESIIILTIHKLGEPDYLELCNVLYVLDALLTKEGKRLPFLRGSVSNERGVILRGLADAIECLYIEKKIDIKTRSEFYILSPNIQKKKVEYLKKEIERKISPKTFDSYMHMLDEIAEIRDRKQRLEKAVEYALKYL
ncbi:MAG: hypothetical protein QW660_06135 [Candidatus Bathyarchaeia archaeon]